MYRYSVPVLLNCPKTIFKLQKSISRNQLVPIGGKVYQRCKLYYQWEKFASLNSRIQVNCTVQCTVRVHILLSYGYNKLEIPVLVRSLKLKQLGPRLTLGWVTIQGLDMDAVATNTVKKSQKSGETGPPLPVYASKAKKHTKIFIVKGQTGWGLCLGMARNLRQTFCTLSLLS